MCTFLPLPCEITFASTLAFATKGVPISTLSKDDTLFATADGTVVFAKKGKFMRQTVSIEAV
jgi:ribosomal protein L27